MSHGAAFWLSNYVQPIGTVSIGVAGFLIARRQWRVANDKFRFDLFGSRLAIYEAVAAELNIMMQQGEENIGIDCIERLELTVVKARLFFGQPVARPIQEATTAARRLFGIHQGGMEYRLLPETLELQNKLFHRITVAGTDTLTIMQDFIDFSEVGRPPYFNAMWRYRRAIVDRFKTLSGHFSREK